MHPLHVCVMYSNARSILWVSMNSIQPDCSCMALPLWRGCLVPKSREGLLTTPCWAQGVGFWRWHGSPPPQPGKPNQHDWTPMGTHGHM